MTNVITRFFEDVQDAHRARDELVNQQRVPLEIIDIFQSSDGLESKLASAHVATDTAKAYAEHLGSGGAVMMVQAGYKPLGVAKITRRVTAAAGASDMGDLVEEVVVKDKPYASDLSVMTHHPLMLTRMKDPNRQHFYMADWPIPLISRKKPYDFALISKHARMASWPFPLISRGEPFTFSLFSDPHGHMANWPIPLISHRKPNTASIFSRHARMADMVLPLISRRKPYTGSLIGKHPRMANWPFPHLINGKTGTNAIIPGAPYMANFPIGLISHRKPNTASIFSRHARMANFPIGLISRRKPYTGSIIPRHARMANRFLPLISTFKVSNLLGLPTIQSR